MYEGLYAQLARHVVESIKQMMLQCWQSRLNKGGDSAQDIKPERLVMHLCQQPALAIKPSTAGFWVIFPYSPDADLTSPELKSGWDLPPHDLETSYYTEDT